MGITEAGDQGGRRFPSDLTEDSERLEDLVSLGGLSQGYLSLESNCTLLAGCQAPATLPDLSL